MVSLLFAVIILKWNAVGAAGSVSVKLNNELIDFDVQPKIIEGRAMVPMRMIFEKIGLTLNGIRRLRL